MRNGSDKAGKFIAVANMKGGVGKTTTVVSLAESLAADDLSASVLVVDLDPQASASLCLAGDETLAEMIESGRTLQDFLEIRLLDLDKKRPLDEFIRAHCSFTLHRGQQLNLSLVPCGPKLRLLERRIIYGLTKRHFSMNAIEGHLQRLFDADFAPMRSRFDYVIFDCPPGISPFTEVTIRSSDVIVVPTIPDRISNFGLDAFCSSIVNNSAGQSRRAPKPYVLASRVLQTRQHKDMLARFVEEDRQPDAAFRLMRTQLPQAAALADALSSEGVQTFANKYGQAVVRTLNALTQEIKEVCHAGGH